MVLAPQLVYALGFSQETSVSDALSMAPRISEAGLGKIIEEECDAAFSVPALTREACEALMQAADSAHKVLVASGTTYFGGRGVIFVDDLGAGWLLDLLLLVANVIAARLFPRDTGLREGSSSAPNEGMLDWRHGFILKSTASHASSARPLVPHTDDAELTMNACLGRNFEGGEILLGGLRGTDDEHRDLNCAADCYVPQPWRALIHLGRRLHAVKQLQQGERRALIVWFRSLRAVRSGVCPCCLLNRRHDGKQGDCISGSRWNRPNDPSAAGVS
mmetsp:Transcript_633/g.1313  ORF Transcript_633/g.1313 Transcript_633/m.1313 type:complete len:275 (-) Transcript_633:395-1219(-)